MRNSYECLRIRVQQHLHNQHLYVTMNLTTTESSKRICPLPFLAFAWGPEAAFCTFQFSANQESGRSEPSGRLYFRTGYDVQVGASETVYPSYSETVLFGSRFF